MKMKTKPALLIHKHGNSHKCFMHEAEIYICYTYHNSELFWQFYRHFQLSV